MSERVECRAAAALTWETEARFRPSIHPSIYPSIRPSVHHIYCTYISHINADPSSHARTHTLPSNHQAGDTPLHRFVRGNVQQAVAALLAQGAAADARNPLTGDAPLHVAGTHVERSVVVGLVSPGCEAHWTPCNIHHNATQHSAGGE